MTRADLAVIEDLSQAAVLLDPLRLRIMTAAREPVSAADVARSLRLPRQKVNYHVRQLARAKLLRRAGQARRRNLVEQRYVASAAAYVLSPALLGPIAVGDGPAAGGFSAPRLVALAARAQADVSRAIAEASTRGLRLAATAVATDVHFDTADARRAFADALHAAVTDVVSRFGAARRESARPYRLLVACYPLV